jgi:hypothetical protein
MAIRLADPAKPNRPSQIDSKQTLHPQPSDLQANYRLYRGQNRDAIDPQLPPTGFSTPNSTGSNAL